jgi:hypothetical protein
MAIPNNTPNDSGRKSLAAHAWQTRRAVSKGNDKPKKDLWDIIDIIAKAVIAGLTVVAAIVIPIVVANIAAQVQRVVTAQNTGKDYMQIALNILENKDVTQDMQKNVGLRKWAVGLLKYYSPVSLDEPTTDKLINGEVEIPLVNDNSQESAWGPPDPSSAFQTALPHNHGFASLNTDGVLRVRTSFARYTAQTGIKSPKGLCFIPEGNTNSELLVVFNNQTFALYFTQLDTARGRRRVIPPIQVSPPNGICQLMCNSYDLYIIVKGADNKEIHYDLDGNEIK